MSSILVKHTNETGPKWLTIECHVETMMDI